MPMETSTATPVANPSATTAPLAGAKSGAPVAAAPAKITGEARLNAILRILQEKHGFHFPVALFDPKTDK